MGWEYLSLWVTAFCIREILYNIQKGYTWSTLHSIFMERWNKLFKNQIDILKFSAYSGASSNIGVHSMEYSTSSMSIFYTILINVFCYQEKMKLCKT